jgi:phenylacetate-CoA ligase
MERTYWNMEIESILNTPRMRELQLSKIQRLVKRLYEAKPFWRQWLDQARVRPEDITSLDEFARRVPVFDKAQRRKVAEECRFDMAEVVDRTISVPLEDVVLMAATSGTTGEPTPYPFTRNDLAWLSEGITRVAWRMGIRPQSRVVFAFGLSMFFAGIPYVISLQKLGCLVIPVGAEAGTERILRYARHFKPDTLCCTPSLAEHLIEKAPELIGTEVGDLGIRRLFCAGEPGAGIPEVKARIESAYRAKLYDHGAGLGVSCDHEEYQGMHFVGEDLWYYELVDQETHEPVPFVDGAVGIPVHTMLEGEGLLTLRESIGDVAQVFTEPCACGKTGFRYRVLGRTDDMLKVKGVMVYPAAIDGVISRFIPRVTGEFRIVLDEPPPRVVPPLRLKIEHGESAKQEELGALAQEIEEKLNSKLKVSPRVEWVAPNTLERSTHKTKFIEKAYERKK